MAAPPIAHLSGMDYPATPSASEGSTREEVSRMLPVAFVLSLVVACHAQFVSQHCAPMIVRPWLPAWGARNEALSLYLGLTTMAFFYLGQSLFLYCYFRCVCTPPGGVPNTPMWQHFSEVDFIGALSPKTLVVTERKESSGERRFCRWCAKYKPDRTHHCRHCKACIRKMDHHCPWVGNCIGFKNHKAFLLCLFYGTVTVDFAATVHFLRRNDQSFFHGSAVVLLVMDGVWALLATGLTLFGLLHLWLLVHGKTTLEFREKGWNSQKTSTRTDYNWGIYGNVCAVLGDRPHLWLVPVANSLGDGLEWTAPEPRPRPASSCKLGMA